MDSKQTSCITIGQQVGGHLTVPPEHMYISRLSLPLERGTFQSHGQLSKLPVKMGNHFGIFCLISLTNYTKEFLLQGLPINHRAPKCIPEGFLSWPRILWTLDFLTTISLEKINRNISGEISLGVILLLQESASASFQMRSSSDFISQEITMLVSEYSSVTRN